MIRLRRRVEEVEGWAELEQLLRLMMMDLNREVSSQREEEQVEEFIHIRLVDRFFFFIIISHHNFKKTRKFLKNSEFRN